MYTASSLAGVLKRAGFTHIERCAYRKGRCPDLEALDNRPDVSFVHGRREVRAELERLQRSSSAMRLAR
jgi:hypothetical protein